MRIRDQIGRLITINKKPEQIVSLVPSITEFLFDLGLEDQICAITDYCIHPGDKVRLKTRIGGPKDINIPRILSLNPDLVIASKEENTRPQIRKLINTCNVYVSDVKNLHEALKLMEDLGAINQVPDIASEIITGIKSEFNQLKHRVSSLKKVAYLIWEKPYMTINKDTFIHDILLAGGFSNVFANKKERYPEISLQEIQTLNPDYIFLPTEPYPFKNQHITQFKSVCPHAIIKRVDGEIFAWYGSHLIKVNDYFKHLL
ncbi:MAG: helical backbone metal receptor [Bacteroidales bacterium]|jgi:ABC-type Fe3+-hydroxamate transport system substrate-binding protein|nr:helical backbone metal receptor [Bacteroidales bacterium]